MYWLLEGPEKIKEFNKRGYTEAYIDLILNNDFQHPVENEIIAIYIRPIEAKKGYILSLKHPDCINYKYEDIEQIILSFSKIYVRDKKNFIHFIPLKNLYDITLNQPYVIKYPNLFNVLSHYYKDNIEINKIIPIVKHYELHQSIFEDLKSNINNEVNEFFNKKASIVFNFIERSGLKVTPKIKEYFPETNPGILYTNYNFKTTTTRPSNSFNGINFAALNKNNGVRKCFIPFNDLLLEIDISAYHPTILAQLIGYEFETEDIHGEFAKMYKVDYNEAKHKTFQQLYGGVFKEYKHLEFFQKVEQFTEKIWDEFNNKGFIQHPISKFKFYKNNLDQMNPQKLLNYYLQHSETVINIEILWQVIPLMLKTKSKLILYVYDSILIDWDRNEKELINNIIDIFSSKKLNIKINQGKNYDF